MRALTVRQPWAWAIIHADPPKDVENRTRNLAGSYRGRVAIHAGLTFEDKSLQDPVLQAALPRDGVGAQRAFLDRHVHGAFIGVATLVEVHRSSLCEGTCSPWAQADADWHLGFIDATPLVEPVPARGRLGLWTPPPDVLDQLQAVV